SATPSATSSARSGAGGEGASEPKLELELLAVLLVPVGADLSKPEPPNEGERRDVVRADRGNESRDLVLPRSPLDQGAHDLSRVAAAAVGLEDRVADLDGVVCLDRVHTRGPVEAGVADHRMSVVRKDDPVDEPGLELRLLTELA